MPEEKPNSEPRPDHVRLPGFVSDEDVGLGDAIKQVTDAVVIPPCNSGVRWAAPLNRWFVFTGRSR
jgi:hypothetical protein